jgi:iron complex outermembrane receptor protein
MFNNLGLSAGMRFERYELDNRVEYSRPVFRAGMNYQLGESAFLRASFGQGYRFPSVAEKFTATNVGSLNVFPNPDLSSESGWNGEIGLKQGLKMHEWYGYVDIAGFWSEYRDMIEFNFGIYGPSPVPTLDDYGFKALNVGNTRIAGFEISVAGEGNAGSVPLTLLAGYTFMHPVDLDARDSLGSGSGNILKYRQRHSVKADAEIQIRRFIFGTTMVFNSRMEKIDEVFLDNLYGNLILPGFPDYWEENNGAIFVADARCIYKLTGFMKIGLVVKNIFNREYVGRPGDIQPPRNITLRLAFDF